MRKLNSIILSLLLALSFVGMHVNAEEIQEETAIEETIDEVTAEEAVEQDLEVVEVNNELEEEVLIVEETTSEETNEEEPLLVEDPQEEIIEEEIVEEAPIEEVIEEVVVEEEIVKSEAKAKQLNAPADSEGDEGDTEKLDAIYLNPSKGNDTNNGSKDSPVKSFEQAKQLLEENPDLDTIFVMSTITASGTMSLPEGKKLKRYNGYTGTLIRVASGETLILENIVIDGDKEQDNSDSAVYVSGNLIMNEGTVIKDNRNGDNWYDEGGGIYVASGATATMNSGVIENCRSGFGAGVGVFGTFVMNGGTIANNEASYKSGEAELCSGGGVGIGKNGVMYFNGGTIDNNYATMYGGGISLGDYYDRYVKGYKPCLYMNGGTISNNKSGRAGGGIFIQANGYAFIGKGMINNNTSMYSDYAYPNNYSGGGIYVNGGYSGYRNGLLELTKAYVSGNSSGSLGGGIANCPTSVLSAYLSNGLAIGENYSGKTKNDFYISSIMTGYHSGRPRMYLSSVMLGGRKNNWTYLIPSEKKGESFEYLDKIYRLPDYKTNIALVNDISAEDLEKGHEKATVFIINNIAQSGRGGGIGSNGTVRVGIEYPDYGELKVTKTVLGDDTAKQGEYRIRVTLNYKVTGTYGDMEFVDGVAEFTIKDGESRTAENLIPEIEYTVEEIDAEGFAVSYKEGNTGSIIANEIKTVEVLNTQLTEVSGSKTWKFDSEDERPESITVNLLVNGEIVESKEVTKEDDWKYSFVNLLKYDGEGNEIVYCVSENDLENYIATIDGYDITNTRKPEKVLVSKQSVSGEELVGASLEIYDVDNKLITSWVSDGNEKEIELLPGTYVLHEKEAPELYGKVEDITFEVDRDGNVTLVKYNEREVRVEGNKLVVIDYFTPETPDEPKPSIPPTPRTPSNTPKKPSVNTSDNTNSLLWFGLMIMSLGVAIITAKKFKEDK